MKRGGRAAGAATALVIVHLVKVLIVQREANLKLNLQIYSGQGAMTSTSNQALKTCKQAAAIPWLTGLASLVPSPQY